MKNRTIPASDAERDDQWVISIGLDDFLRPHCITAVADLDGLDIETVNAWTNDQLSARLSLPFEEPEDYDGQYDVIGALYGPLTASFFDATDE